MSFFSAMLADSGIPPVPPSFAVASFTLTGTGRANVNTRQTALEPSASTVDKPYSWSCWLRVSNIGTAIQRIFSSGLTASGDFQYALSIRETTSAASVNQKLVFQIFTNNSNFISIFSTNRILKSRWVHVAITYDGSETAAGLKMYLNGIEDTTANKTLTGTYTGALNNSSIRMQLGHVFTANRLRGNLRDLCCWNAELTSTEVTELYLEASDPGHPKDVTSVSFYGAKIAAYWPLHSDFTSPQSANYTFVSVTGISFSSRPLSSLYPSWSCLNARIGNTKYFAFSSAFRVGNKAHIYIGRGDTHVVNTTVSKGVFDPSNLFAANPVTWVDDVNSALPDGIRGGNVGLVNGNVVNIVAQYDDVALQFKDLGRYDSTDGAVGEAFAAFVSMETAVTGHSINAYGNIIAGDAAGQYMIGCHDYLQDLSAQTIFLFETLDNGATWTRRDCFTGDSTKGYNEAALVRVSAGNYVMLVREQAGNQLSCSVSTDGAITWSTPVDSGLCVGYGNASMCLDDDGNIVVFYIDRGDGYAKVSLGNVPADVLADPTDWNAGSSVFQTIDESINILGNAWILNMGNGFFAGGVSSEQNPPSATRADHFVFYGAFGAG